MRCFSVSTKEIDFRIDPDYYLPEIFGLLRKLKKSPYKLETLDDISQRVVRVNVKRGMRKKVSDGWVPHVPPLGYLNNRYNLPEHPPVYPDPERFINSKPYGRSF